MKRIMLIIFASIMGTAICSAAMSNSKVRKETRFLTDKMAYELNLNTEQYNDVYEINYDFIAGIRYLMDDVLRGEEWALNRYYDYLDVRNDDLRWVLSSRQYSRFMQASYFYRPVYVSGGRWEFRIYINFTNHNHFYFPRPYHYRTYCGGHYRTNHHNTSYYRGRYNHPVYNGVYRIRNDRSYHTARRSDFGSVTIRPNSSTRPTGNAATTTRRTGSTGSKREHVNTSSRPANAAGSSTRRSVSNSNSPRRTSAGNTKYKDNTGNTTRRSRVNTDSKDKKPSSNSRSSRSVEKTRR